MKEIVNQVDKEKKEIVKKYERYIRELNVKINKLTGNKMKISTSIPETKKSRSKDKTTGNKLKTQIKKSANNLIAVTDLLGVNRINRSPSLKSLKKVSNVSVGYDSPKSVKSSKSGKKIKKSKKSSVEKKNLTNQNNLGLLSSSNIHSLSSPRSLGEDKF